MVDNHPAVTVIAPLHNAADSLAGFLPRLEATLEPDYEALLVDDGSTDATGEIITAWASERPNVRALVLQQNVGVARARNRAVAEARGEYLWFTDHDDEWHPDIVRTLLAHAQGADVVVCRARYVTGEGDAGRIIDGVGYSAVLDGAGLIRLMLRGEVHGYLWSKLLRRSLLGAEPFPARRSLSDFSGLVLAARRARTVRTVPDVLYTYINRIGSITRGKAPVFEDYLFALDRMRECAPRTGAEDEELLGYFERWFGAHALAFQPVRRRSEEAVRRRGIELARDVLREARPSRSSRYSWRTAAEMAVLRYVPSLYAPLVGAALSAYDTRRATRARRQVSSPQLGLSPALSH